jgi:poly(A) polymerase
VHEAAPSQPAPPEATPKEQHVEIPPERLDGDALRVVARLRRFQHTAYLVGGCVRDLLLGLRPKDFDVATSAHPQEIREVFRNSRLIGRRFRLAHVYFHGGKVIEVSTFRQAPEPEDGTDGDLLIRRDNVFGSAEDDARRRDFTINALFYDTAHAKVIDYVGGLADVAARELRTIGDPEVRMREDPVRILRVIRFAARLDLQIDPATWAAACRHVKDIARCAPPRVLEEVLRLLRCGASRRAIELMRTAGALEVAVPPLAHHLAHAPHEEVERVLQHLAAADAPRADGQPRSDAVLMAALLVSVEPAKVDGLLRALVRDARLPKRVAERVRLVLACQPALRGERKPRRAGAFTRQPFFPEALDLLEITVRATGKGADALELWRQRAAGHPPPHAHAEPPPHAGAPAPEGKRRRRRRRRRKRGSAAGDAPPPPSKPAGG